MKSFTARRHDNTYTVLVDDDDYEWVSQYRWHVDNEGYVRRGRRKSESGPRMIKLHRVIMRSTSGDGLDVDHINGDRLDNRKINLRRVSRSENMQNSQGHRDRKASERGVSFHVASGRWVAQHMYNGVRWHEFYETEEEAVAGVRAHRAELLGFENTLAELSPPLRDVGDQVLRTVLRPRLRAEQVIAIRQRIADGEPIRSVAEDLGMGKTAIAEISAGRRYKHIGGPIRKIHRQLPRDASSDEKRQVALELLYGSIDLDPDGCWLWRGVRGSNGSRCVEIAGKTHMIHRLAYEIAFGPLPPRVIIDHACHRADPYCPGDSRCQHRRCIRPDHLVARNAEPSSSPSREDDLAA